MAITVTPANSIWPNGLKVDDEGYVVFYPLGTNKIDVPTAESDWPVGDKLVSPFVYQNGKLVGFCDTKAMTVSDNTTISLPYTHIEADFSSIEEGKLTVNAPNATVKKFSWAVEDSGNTSGTIPLGTKYKNCTTIAEVKAIDSDYLKNDIIRGRWNSSLESLTASGASYSSSMTGLFDNHLDLISFKSDLKNLSEGKYMFCNCYALESFEADLSNLTSASSMFSRCYYLTSFKCNNLNKLKNGSNMFYYCYYLDEFNFELPELDSGSSMFYDCNLKNFKADMPKLTNGRNMFNGALLSAFNSNISKVSDGRQMFYQCKNLTSFGSKLSSLTKGDYMFDGCSLDTASVENIAENINTPSTAGVINISIANSTPNTNEVTAFKKIASKNWTVYVNSKSYTYPATSTANTNITDKDVSIIPFYAKPVISTEEDAHYINADGQYYNILGGQYIYGDDLSTYGMFANEEDAAANMRLTKIERN